MDLLLGFTVGYNVNSPTTNISITESKMTRHKCHDAQANPLLCEPRWSQDEGAKTRTAHIPVNQHGPIPTSHFNQYLLLCRERKMDFITLSASGKQLLLH